MQVQHLIERACVRARASRQRRPGCAPQKNRRRKKNQDKKKGGTNKCRGKAELTGQVNIAIFRSSFLRTHAVHQSERIPPPHNCVATRTCQSSFFVLFLFVSFFFLLAGLPAGVRHRRSRRGLGLGGTTGAGRNGRMFCPDRKENCA